MLNDYEVNLLFKFSNEFVKTVIQLISNFFIENSAKVLKYKKNKQHRVLTHNNIDLKVLLVLTT